MSSESSPPLKKLLVEQEKLFRKEYEELYEVKCKERGNAPLPYAAWRHHRLNADLGNVDRINEAPTSETA